MEILQRIHNFYNWVETISDPRVKDWPLISSPLPTYILSFFYVIFSWKIGPYLMRHREPFNLKYPLVMFNAAMWYLNLHIFKELVLGMIDAGYTWPCQPFIVSYDPKHMRIAAAIWWYYASKLIEFVDTLFFVLRKKNNQISFLHVYHHATMPMLWWIGTKWVPASQSAHAAVLNAFIHILMYFYYGVAALGPRYQKYLWWKRYLTQMQLIQFCIALGLAIHSLYTNCDFPRWMSWALMLYMVSFLFLFGNFYIQAYIKGSRKRAENANADPKYENGTPYTNGASPRKQYNFRRRSKLE